MGRDNYLQRQYNITSAEYDKILAYQGGICAICKRPPKPGKYLNVDHNHKTGEVLGLLCFRCNKALGAFNNDVVLLGEAHDYLMIPPVAEVLGVRYCVPGRVGTKKRRKLIKKITEEGKI